MKGNAVVPEAKPESAVATPESDIESGTREELIRQAAYRRFQARGGSGSESDTEQDWLDAEAEAEVSRSSTRITGRPMRRATLGAPPSRRRVRYAAGSARGVGSSAASIVRIKSWQVYSRFEFR